VKKPGSIEPEKSVEKKAQDNKEGFFCLGTLQALK
jgi:hypothetical protein